MTKTRQIPLIFVLLALVGCSDRNSDERLVNLAVSVEKNSARIEELSLAMDGVDKRLVSIEESLEKLAHASPPLGGSASAPSRSPAKGSDNTEDLSRQVALLAQEVASTKEELASTGAAVEEVRSRLSKPKDIHDALHKLAGKPDEFARGLDELLRVVSPKIEDPAVRRNFEAEVAQLRDRVVGGFSQEQLYNELRGRMLEKLNFLTDEKDRQQLQRGLSELENASPKELEKGLSEYARDRILEEAFRIGQTYGLEKEDTAALLVSGVVSKAKTSAFPAER